MADVRTFRAASMQEALDLVREEMGSDAVILHTRQVEARRKLPFLKPREEVEITAGLGVNVRPVQQHAPTAVRATASESTPHGFRRHSTETATAARPKSNHDDDPLGLLSAIKARSTQEPTPPAGATANHRSMTDRRDPPRKQLPASNWHTPTARAANPPSGRPASTLPESAGPIVVSGRVPSETTVQDFARKLDSIQQMIHKLGQSRVSKTEEIPQELFQLYTDLIDADLDDEEARELISRVKREAGPGTLGNVQATRALLAAIVESHIRVAPPISVRNGRRHVVALVGPTGVGKTTTIAKLAANFRLREGVRMGLVTVDTYRIAAVEQLRTYAEIIDLPMKVVTSPPEMRRALDELSGLDLVLIDTAGRSPRDELKIQELKSLLAEAQVDEVQLVMSLTASLKSLQATAQKFAAAGTTSMILTKLDEAAGAGALFSAACRVPLPISYLTTGQDVPEDIEPANARRISRLVLGEDRVLQ